MNRNELEHDNVPFSELIQGAKLVGITQVGNEVLCEMESGAVVSVVINGKPLQIEFPYALDFPVPVDNWCLSGNTASCYAADYELLFHVTPVGQNSFDKDSTDSADLMFLRKKA